MRQILKKNVFKAIAMGLVMLACLIPVSASAACSTGEATVQKQVYINGKASDSDNNAVATDTTKVTTKTQTQATEDCTPETKAQAPAQSTTVEKKTENAAQPAQTTKPEAKAETPAKTAPATTTEKKTETPAQQTQTPAANNSSVSATEREVVRLVNEIRKQNGLKELTLNEELAKVARVKAEDMANNKYFSHNSPTYGSPFDMMKKFGISYKTAGENIAMGQTTAQAVVDAWMNSPGHRANILNASFTQIGVGHTANGNYWSQMFIG